MKKLAFILLLLMTLGTLSPKDILAQEKLGYGFDAREMRRRQQRDAERMALSAINSFARDLDIGLGLGVTRRGTGGVEPSPRRDLGADPGPGRGAADSRHDGD